VCAAGPGVKKEGTQMPLLVGLTDRQGKTEGKRGYGLLCTTSLLHDALWGKRRGKSSTPSSSESSLHLSRFQVRGCVHADNQG
jgi:hypothetical protein